LGQGSVGKTSLVNRILNNFFSQREKKTEGIAISRWEIEDISQSKVSQFKIQINIWDFGGQEIMHATHQFFLTKRSLYLLVLDSRLTQEENRVEYWLKIIQSFGGESPVIIVGNKTDQHPLDIDQRGLQNKYPNIVGIIETSAATGKGIKNLKSIIVNKVNNLPHVRDQLPMTWFTIKNQLEVIARKQNFITHDKYLNLCLTKEVFDETSQYTLIGFLHDLGVVLHFQDEPRLEALGILNPQWVTNGVYKILNSREIFDNKGVLELSMLNEILNTPEYPSNKRLFIVDMMRKFELCYDIIPDQIFLVPDLLPKDEPKLAFNGIPAFEYIYPVLPYSVITRLIVRMNQKIDDEVVWRTGVLLKIGENKALVKADTEDRKITIAIDGLEHTRRDALSAIRYHLDEIHASIKGLKPKKRVPIPKAPNAEPLEYDYLLMLERAGREATLVKNGTSLAKVNVREILSGIESETRRREQGGNVTNIYIRGNVEGSNIVSSNNNVITQKIEASFNKADDANIQAELKANLKELAEAVAVMSKELPKEQAIEAADDMKKLVEEAIKLKPNEKWYSVSIEGLIKAAENLGRLGEPVISLSKKVLLLLTSRLSNT
jgi:internalin A